MEIHAGLLAYFKCPGKDSNTASLDTNKEQCLQNPLILFPPTIHMCEFTLPNGKLFSHAHC